MARRSIDVPGSGMMIVRKKAKKDLDGGSLGLRQVRKLTNTVTSPRLLKIMGCMAGKLAGKKPGTLGKAQAAFKAARSACK